MQITEYEKKYNNSYNDVNNMINNIIEMGFDSKQYELKLKEIIDNFNATNHTLSDYIDAISKLHILHNELYKYDIYHQAFNTCKWLERVIKHKNITSDTLDDLVAQMLYILNNIVKPNSIDNELNIVKKTYQTAYELIKAEITINNESKIYTYLKEEAVPTTYFNKLIIKDIEKINITNHPLLKEKIEEISQSNGDINYFDISLIKRILISIPTCSYKKKS